MFRAACRATLLANNYRQKLRSKRPWGFEQVNPKTLKTPLDEAQDHAAAAAQQIVQQPLPVSEPRFDLLLGLRTYQPRLRDALRSVLSGQIGAALAKEGADRESSGLTARSIALSHAWSERFNPSLFDVKGVQHVLGVRVVSSSNGGNGEGEGSSSFFAQGEQWQRARDHVIKTVNDRATVEFLELDVLAAAAELVEKKPSTAPQNSFARAAVVASLLRELAKQFRLMFLCVDASKSLVERWTRFAYRSRVVPLTINIDELLGDGKCDLGAAEGKLRSLLPEAVRQLFPEGERENSANEAECRDIVIRAVKQITGVGRNQFAEAALPAVFINGGYVGGAFDMDRLCVHGELLDALLNRPHEMDLEMKKWPK